jgi:hypothetical protein
MRHLFTKNPLYSFKINPRSQIISHPYPICSHNNVLIAVALASNPVHFTTTSARFFRCCTLNFKWNQLCNWKWVEGSIKAENDFIVWYDILKARASINFSKHGIREQTCCILYFRNGIVGVLVLFYVLLNLEKIVKSSP